MKVDKMREELLNYCVDRNGCFGCKLKHHFDCRFDEKYGDEIIEAYEIVFGDEENRSYTDEKVNHPVHYQGKNECIDVMVAMFGKEAVKHFCMCNAYKYRFRADMKNGAEDIEKAEWYESKLIELGGVDNEKN